MLKTNTRGVSCFISYLNTTRCCLLINVLFLIRALPGDIMVSADLPSAGIDVHNFIVANFKNSLVIGILFCYGHRAVS